MATNAVLTRQLSISQINFRGTSVDAQVQSLLRQVPTRNGAAQAARDEYVGAKQDLAAADATLVAKNDVLTATHDNLNFVERAWGAVAKGHLGTDSFTARYTSYHDAEVAQKSAAQTQREKFGVKEDKKTALEKAATLASYETMTGTITEWVKADVMANPTPRLSALRAQHQKMDALTSLIANQDTPWAEATDLFKSDLDCVEASAGELTSWFGKHDDKTMPPAFLALYGAARAEEAALKGRLTSIVKAAQAVGDQGISDIAKQLPVGRFLSDVATAGQATRRLAKPIKAEAESIEEEMLGVCKILAELSRVATLKAGSLGADEQQEVDTIAQDYVKLSAGYLQSLGVKTYGQWTTES